MENIFLGISPSLVWFMIGFLLLVIEIVTPGLVIGFFGVGAWCAGGLCLMFELSILTQLLIFILVSVTGLVLLRRSLHALLFSQAQEKDLEGFVGEKAVVVRQIRPQADGKIEFRGTHWRAKAGEAIPEGAVVEIVARQNITLVVKMLTT